MRFLEKIRTYFDEKKNQYNNNNNRWNARCEDKNDDVEVSLYHSWSFIRGEKKTMYGKMPDGYREDVAIVYVNLPSHARLILDYIESDHFHYYLKGYLSSGHSTYRAIGKGHMLRMFNGTIIDYDMTLRTKHDLCMGRWWTIHNYHYIEDTSKHDIYCDTYLKTGWQDIS